MLLTPCALTADAYQRYGDVIQAGSDPASGVSANQGTARKWNHVAALVDHRPGTAVASLSVFRCAPWAVRPVPVVLLERHAGSTQAFIPMGARRYLVVVALGDETPDPGTIQAFVATGTQGVTYRPGVWHHPMIALDEVTDFACLVWEDGSSRDCDVVNLAPGDRCAVAVR